MIQRWHLARVPRRCALCWTWLSFARRWQRAYYCAACGRLHRAVVRRSSVSFWLLAVNYAIELGLVGRQFRQMVRTTALTLWAEVQEEQQS